MPLHNWQQIIVLYNIHALSNVVVNVIYISDVILMNEVVPKLYDAV